MRSCGTRVLVGVHIRDGLQRGAFEMWWPRLETEINDILKSKDNAEKKDIRLERDILEELLELTRMNVSRLSTPRLSAPTVMDLMNAVNDFLVLAPGEAAGIALMKGVARPLRQICMEDE